MGAEKVMLDSISSELPLLDRIEIDLDHKSLIAECALNLKRHPYLRDHLFINAAQIKSDEDRLPVLPFAAALELLVEAAAPLAPNLGLIGMENVIAKNWVELNGPAGIILTIKAQCQEVLTPETKVQVSVEDADSGGLYLSGTVLFGSRYSEQIKFKPQSNAAQNDHEITAENIYASGDVFHGPIFHCLHKSVNWSDKYIRGTIILGDTKAHFAPLSQGDLFIDPVLIDGVGQLLAFWGMRRRVYPFPIAIEALEIYQARPRKAAQFPVYIQLRQLSQRFLVGDVEVQDGSGNVWLRISGFRSWCFQWPESYHAFRCRPSERSLSIALSGGYQGESLFRISEDEIRDGDLNHIAGHYLTTDEVKEFRLLSGEELRKDWLLERVVAKDAYREFIRMSYSRPMFHPASFALEPLSNPNTWRTDHATWSSELTLETINKNGNYLGRATTNSTDRRDLGEYLNAP